MKGRFPTRQRWWLASFIGLPYFMYGAMLIMVYLLVTAMMQRGRSVWQLCGQTGFGWLTAGLLLSSSFGINRGDAFLQLANFLPFFVLWGVLATHPAIAFRPFAKLESVAQWLVLSAIPLCAIAIAEYIVKFEGTAQYVRSLPLPQRFFIWLYEEPSFGHRAHSLFDHPNGLSAYLVMILGLGLGLLLKTLADGEQRPLKAVPSSRYRLTLLAAVALCVSAVFCTGSRNGLLIALVLGAIALYAARRYRWVLLSGLASLGAISAAVVSFGIGGRSLSLAIFTGDPRLGVWRLAIEMIQERPLLGWGLSGLRERYIPDSIPGYDSIFHAHNIWLFLASESGIPVMLGFCVICGTLCYRAVRTYLGSDLTASNRAVLFSYLLAFSACLMFALFDVVLHDARLNIPAWGLLAALYVMSRPAYRRAS